MKGKHWARKKKGKEIVKKFVIQNNCEFFFKNFAIKKVRKKSPNWLVKIQ
jgi:hypothetical protein